jgi:hypothetical protein
MNGKSAAAVVFLLITIALACYPSAYAWGSSPQITHSLDASGNTVLTIQFNFSEMSDPPTTGHYPTRFQVHTSTGGPLWTELPPVAITPTPKTTVFTVTYNLGRVSGTIDVQARLECSIHGWSDWGPISAVSVPEFPFGMIAVISLLLLIGSVFLFRRRHLIL